MKFLRKAKKKKLLTNKVALKTVLKAGYNSPDSEKKLTDSGYVPDNELSNHNEKVYYHPQDRKLLVNVVGTHNVSDWLTDTSLLFGGLKHTHRFNHAVKTTETAKNKYKPVKTVLTGHSLGGAIVSRMPADDHTEKITYNKASTFEDILGGSDRKHETHYRTANDPASLLSALAPNTKTIKATTWDPVAAHKSEAIGDTPIFL